MKRKAYPSHISDSKWAIIAPLIPKTKTRGLDVLLFLKERGFTSSAFGKLDTDLREVSVIDIYL